VFDKINENFIRCSFFELCSRYLSSYYTFAIEQNNSVGCSNFEMTGIPGTNYYKDDRLVEFKYFKAKEAEHMLALNDPAPRTWRKYVLTPRIPNRNSLYIMYAHNYIYLR